MTQGPLSLDHLATSFSFQFPTSSRLPTFVHFGEHVERRHLVKFESLPYAKDPGVDFCFNHTIRLPLFVKPGTESEEHSIPNQGPREVPVQAHGRYESFNIYKRHALPPLVSLLDSAVELMPTVTTRLAQNGAALSIPEAKGTGRVSGPIVSVGEYIRPNADSSILLSITPVSDAEALKRDHGGHVVIGVLEKARSSEKSSRSEERPVSLEQEAKESSSPKEFGEDEKTCEQRRRFDQLVDRLKQKLLERRAKSECAAGGVTKTVQQRPTKSERRHGHSSQSTADGASIPEATLSDQHEAPVQPANTIRRENTESSGSSFGAKSGSGPQGTTSSYTTIHSAGSEQSEGDAWAHTRAQGDATGKSDMTAPPPPQLAFPATAPHPMGGGQDPTARSGTPFHALAAAAPPGPYPGSMEPPPVTQAAQPHPALWQTAPPVFPNPAAPVSCSYPLPGMPVPPFPSRQHAKRRDRNRFRSFNAAEQQKIEEQLEYLRSTIPHYAAVSKRRQEKRWVEQQERTLRQLERDRWAQIRGFQSQPWALQPQWLPPQWQPQHMQQLYQQPAPPMTARTSYPPYLNQPMWQLEPWGRDYQ